MVRLRECYRSLQNLRRQLNLTTTYRNFAVNSTSARSFAPSLKYKHENLQVWAKSCYCASPQQKVQDDQSSEKPAEKFEFQAETRMLLDIVAKSLYSDKEVFIRELISNSSDALEKARYHRISEGIPHTDSEMKITIDTNKQSNTITIQDNGIGMTRDELVQNLGTIARSGSKAFIEELKKKGQSDVSNSVIGQFGVGFYSVFMVADRVEVITKSIKADGQALKWVSDGSGSYEISPCAKAESGTEIVIYLKPDCREYADSDAMEKVIKKYSSFVSHSILLNGKKANVVEPLWLKNPKQVSDNEHREFYQYMTGARDSPRFILHYKVDVPYSINAVLYFPEAKPAFFDPSVHGGVSLFARRVLIKNKADEIIPKWLRFVRGVVDSEDIPLNLSREILQNTALLRTIRNTLTKRILKFLQEKSSKDKQNYSLFYKEFGLFFKEGIISVDNQQEREDISKLLLYETSKSGPGEVVTMTDYVSRMKENQKKIYYLSAPSRVLAETSPYMETMKNKDMEVIYCYEPYDEYVLMHLHSVNQIPLCSVEAEARVNTSDPEQQSTIIGSGESNIDDLLGWMKTSLKEKIEKAIINRSLGSHPCIVTVEEMAQARQYLKLQARSLDDDMKFSIIKPRLEINPKHPLIKELNNLKATNESLATLILEQLFTNALVYAGLLDDARKVVNNVNKIVERVLVEGKGSILKKDSDKQQN